MGRRSRKRRAPGAATGGDARSRGGAAVRDAGVDDAGAAAKDAGGHDAGADALRRGYARGRERDERLRAQLEPLGPGERPKWVTIAAVVAAAMAVINLVGGVVAVGELPTTRSPAAALPWTILLLVAAAGMWRAKYWAVLGFQAALAFQILTLTLALMTASDLLLAAVIIVPIVSALGLLFWKLVRAMARLQMPRSGRAAAP